VLIQGGSRGQGRHRLAQGVLVPAAYGLGAAPVRGSPLGQVKAPTLVIWGERDRYLGEDLAEPEHDDVPNLDRVERLADASHWVHHDEAERVNQLLIDFFA